MDAEITVLLHKLISAHALYAYQTLVLMLWIRGHVSSHPYTEWLDNIFLTYECINLLFICVTVHNMQSCSLRCKQ